MSGVASLIAVVAGAVALIAGAGLPGLGIFGAGLVGGLLSLVGEYAQLLYQVGQGLPFYQLRADLDEGDMPPSPTRGVPR